MDSLVTDSNMKTNGVLETYAFYQVFRGIHDRCFVGFHFSQVQEVAAFSIPYVVNGALACEVALKSFIDDIGKAKSCQHYLDRMYDMIDDDHKRRIESEFISLGCPKEELFSTIKESSRLFVDWRFFYEPDKRALSIPKHFYEMVVAICFAAFSDSELIRFKG